MHKGACKCLVTLWHQLDNQHKSYLEPSDQCPAKVKDKYVDCCQGASENCYEVNHNLQENGALKNNFSSVVVSSHGKEKASDCCTKEFKRTNQANIGLGSTVKIEFNDPVVKRKLTVFVNLPT